MLIDDCTEMLSYAWMRSAGAFDSDGWVLMLAAVLR